jgi:peroxiredoxin
MLNTLPNESGFEMSRCNFLLAMLILVALTASASAAEVASSANSPASLGFRLTDADGKVTEVAAQAKQQLTVVCFLGIECPMARQYGPRLNKLATEFAAQNVRFVGVNSNSQDSQKEVAAFTKEYGIAFPILKDPGNKIADQFGARHMVEVFVLDQTLAIRYHGRIDDQFLPGVMRSQPTRQDLRIALEELLAGKPVNVAVTETSGCSIGRVRTPLVASEYTFCKQVSRILNQHCVECHRPDEIGPFSLTDYNEVTGWGDTILESIDSGRMPPWNANPNVGHFQNARSMPEADKQVLRDWVKAGMPYGEATDLPPTQEYTSGWLLNREPELVLKMRDRPFHVPATGTIEYQYYVVDPHFEEDHWVDGTDVRGVGYLTGYVPGQRSFMLPEGYARRVPAGSKFVFQMHYTPNGIEQDDLTQLGMTFIPESKVTHEVLTLLGIDQEFEIPPYAPDFPVHGNVGWFPKRAELLAIIPHMHVRGKSFQATSRQGDKTETLLDVPRYDFNWQHVYELSKPLKLESIDKLEFTTRFDNSKQNPSNPDPSQSVTWGDQTWEEMSIAFFEVSVPHDGVIEQEPQRNKQKLIVKTGPEGNPRESDDKFVADFFKRFDKNGDGIVEAKETPLGFRKFGFHEFDSNRDGKLTREEIQSAAEHRKR